MRRGGTRRRRSGKRRLAVVLALPVVLSVALVLPLRWVDPMTSSIMLQTRYAKWRNGGSFSVHHEWVDCEAISAELKRAVLASEDQKFFSHRGFDFQAIRGAIREADGLRPTRGASTISQQLAKNLWLWGGRSWLRKGLEAWLTVWLEFLLPKQRILELYLNVAQFGPAMYGVEAASRRYFGVPAAAVGPAEAARLAAVLPGPSLYRVREPQERVLRRQAWIEAQAGRMVVPACR